jgi:hypothetical protein
MIMVEVADRLRATLFFYWADQGITQAILSHIGPSARAWLKHRTVSGAPIDSNPPQRLFWWLGL